MTPADAVRNTAQRRAAALIAAFLLGAWGLPALGSSGVGIQSDDKAAMTPSPAEPASSSLARRSESTLEQLIDDDSVAVPALAEVANESTLDEAAESDRTDEAVLRDAETPVIRSRLPGVPKTALPSFRRQMFRTDI